MQVVAERVLHKSETLVQEAIAQDPRGDDDQDAQAKEQRPATLPSNEEEPEEN